MVEIHIVFILFKDTLKAFNDFQNKQQVLEVMRFDMPKYIYSESLFNTIYIEINTNVKKNFLRTKQTLQIMHSFFFPELELITVLLLICNSYTS